ncbi:hypothetical protein GCM10011578_007600 [Streptomyces fuscichromogenes]|uniref:Uncharacterized protein n=1 Tax=Streptomyces fuscichromogenes TaxID=1324013 RepID=A0A917X909_9ACTN|nr:hypothetical protein GCM10011578_007600 [Streptomyces fuscichromogenes]
METFACSLIYLAQCGSAPSGRLKKTVRLNGKGKRQGGGLPAATVSSGLRPCGPARGRQEQAGKTTGGAAAPHSHSRKARFLQTSAVAISEARPCDQVVSTRRRYRGIVRQTLKPWRNLGC